MNTIHPPPSPGGPPPPAGYSVWQRSNPARGIQQTCKLLNLLKTILARMCTFLFSQLLQEQQPYSLNANRDGFLITFAQPKLYLSPSVATLPWRTSAEYSSLHTCSATDPTLKTLSASQLFTLKLRNPPCLPLAPQASRSTAGSSSGFTAAWWTAYWVMTPFVVGEENNCWKFNRFYSQFFPAWLTSLLKWL